MFTRTIAMNQRIDGLTLVSLALILFMGFNVLRDRASTAHASSQLATGSQTAPSLPASTAQPTEAEMLEISAPYEDYILTQGPHGTSYGHKAIDLAAGKGEAVLSPINGIVTERYIDEYDNPTLVIENDIYRVTLLHGKYTVSVGDRLQIGQPVGKESNLGYTADIQGRPCNGRKKCGYHTHLNIYDKRLQANVNPLDLIGAAP